MSRATAIRYRGFTLMEVLVALVIISIGLLGITAMQASAITSTRASQVESLAAIEARSLADAMQANPNYWAAGAFPASFTITAPTTGSLTTPVISDTTLASQSSTACFSAPCTPIQMAGFDVQQWGHQLLTQIPGASATVTCQVGAPSTCTITVSWTQKAPTSINNATTDTSATTSLSYTLVNQF